MKGGLAVPIRTTPDGTFYQEALPHQTRLLTGAYAVGLEYAVTPTWAIQAHYLDLGSSRINGQAVPDTSYDQYQHRCLAPCPPPYSFRATDRLQGVDATVSYTWQHENWQPFVKGGLAVLQHHAVFRNENGAADHFTGILPEIEVGIGLAYQWAYIELDYFRGVNFGGQNLPISTQQVVAFVGIKAPLF
jgi:hypothetical protein